MRFLIALRSQEDEAFVDSAPENVGLEGMQVVTGFVERILSQIELRVQDARLIVQHRHRAPAASEADVGALATPPTDRLTELTMHIPSLVYTADQESERASSGPRLYTRDSRRTPSPDD